MKRRATLTWQEERDLLRAGVPMRHPETREAVAKLVDAKAREAKVDLLRWMASRIYTYENPPPGPRWRRWIFHAQPSTVRDNYTRQSQLLRLADQIERLGHERN